MSTNGFTEYDADSVAVRPLSELPMLRYAGVQALRDLPRFVRLVKKGLFDAKSLVGPSFRVNQMKEALQVAADRSAVNVDDRLHVGAVLLIRGAAV